jgi:hypothetical protein
LRSTAEALRSATEALRTAKTLWAVAEALRSPVAAAEVGAAPPLRNLAAPGAGVLVFIGFLIGGAVEIEDVRAAADAPAAQIGAGAPGAESRLPLPVLGLSFVVISGPFLGRRGRRFGRGVRTRLLARGKRGRQSANSQQGCQLPRLAEMNEWVCHVTSFFLAKFQG